MTKKRNIPRNLGFSDHVVEKLFESSEIPDTHKELFDNIIVPLHVLTIQVSQIDDSVFQIRELEDANLRAAMSLRTSNTGLIASALYELGEIVERFRWNRNTSYKDMVQTLMSRQRQTSGLRELNRKKSQAKILAQRIAKEAWNDDVEKNVRITGMCEIVWNELVVEILSPDFKGAFPDNPDGLKHWMREIAPKYARKPGRPSNTKKKS